MVHACTIIAGNYLPAARVLAQSFFAYHPDGRFTVLIVDDEDGSIAPSQHIDHRIEWRRLADLGLSAADIHVLAGIYDVTELSTSVKPLFLQRLIGEHGGAVIYLDPDIRIFGSLAYVAQLADEYGLVLTPHLTRPIPDDGRQVDELYVLAAGVYNLGFAAFSPAGAACLAWWWERTRRGALNDVQRQMFTDQRWADYMPALFRHHLLKDPGYNVAYWNLHERPISRVNGRLYARQLPLRFFHFSGFDPATPWLLSRHQGERPRILLSEHPELAALADDYAAALEQAGFTAASARGYGWRRTADGIAMRRPIRRLYWTSVIAFERGEGPPPPDPFDAADPGRFTSWLNARDTRRTGRWSRYLQAIYDARPDLQAYVPDINGGGATTFVDWIRTDGVVQEHIPPVLLPPAPPSEEAAHAEDLAALVSANGNGASHTRLNVAGYFHAELGVGEAARLLLRAIDATGVPFTTTVQSASHSRQQHAFQARDAAARAAADVNLLCVNADSTPAFAREAGPSFFAGRHTIGYWFWEVDPLPPAMHGAFDYVDEVWAATDYVAGIVRSAAGGRKPVFTVPVPLVAPTASARTREELGLPANRFIFLFAFDFYSVMARKNPLGLIEAFAAAFAPGEGPVLVLKSINGGAALGDLERLRRAAAHRDDIIIRDGYLSAEDKNAMVARSDCYISLHRAEGLGLTMAEAMALGKPVIATGYSGNRHFMTDANSFLVEYRLVQVPGDCRPYPPEGRWADPDIGHAARLMRTVYEHPEAAARLAECGRADIEAHHGVASSAAAVAGRLAAIRRERQARPAERAAEPAEAATEVPAGSEAFQAFAAALPQLQELGSPRLSDDTRPLQWLRRAGQRALFRFLRPYSFQQRQFQDALLQALHESLRRLPASGPNATAPRQAAPAPRQPAATRASEPPPRRADSSSAAASRRSSDGNGSTTRNI